MDKGIVVAVLLALILGFDSIEYVQANERPPLSALRVGGEIAAGTAGGIAILLAPTPIVDRSLKETDAGVAVALGYFYLISALAVTHPLGTATGVYLAGNIGDESGPFWATLGSSCIGGFAGAVIFFLGLEAGGQAYVSGIMAAALAAPVVATIAFNKTRKSENPYFASV